MVPAASVEFRSPETPPSILVPLDSSEVAETSLGPASELAKQLRASLVLLNVVTLPAYALYGEAGSYIAFDADAELMQAQKYLARIARNLQPTLKDVRVRAEIGNPADCIAQVAAGEGVALIAMATHGRTGIARIVLGSVATGVLRRASVPLMLVRPALEVGSAESAGGDARLMETCSDDRPVVHVDLTRSDLDLLQRGLGELLYKPGGDVACSPRVRELTGRLKRIESAIPAELPGAKS
jgi:nucleotide-binding universal stress UspA family protein